MPKHHESNDPPRVNMVPNLKESGHSKGSPLSYSWGKIKEDDSLILFDPNSTHNFKSTKLATKLGIHDFEMGEAIQVDSLD